MHRTFDIPTSGLFARQSRLGRLDVRAKLIVSLAAILVVVLSTQPWLPLATLVASLAVLRAARVPARTILCRLAGPLAIAVVVGILQTFTGTQPLCSCRLGPLHLTLTSDGLGAGGMVVARVVGSVSVLIALWAMAPAYGIFAALRWAGVPRTWVEIAMLMHRYTFALLEQAAGVLAAQKVRLGYAGLRQSLGSMGSLAGIVTLRSIDQAEKTHEAMLARGYHDSLQIPALPPLAKRDILLIACSIAIIALAWLITERSLP